MDGRPVILDDSLGSKVARSPSAGFDFSWIFFRSGLIVETNSGRIWSMSTFGFCAALAFALVSTILAQSPVASGSTASVWMPPESSFKKVILDEDALVDGVRKDTIVDPMELTVAPDGRVFWVERAGVVKLWKPDTKSTVVAARLATPSIQDFQRISGST
jgi:hypothetical protein